MVLTGIGQILDQSPIFLEKKEEEEEEDDKESESFVCYTIFLEINGLELVVFLGEWLLSFEITSSITNQKYNVISILITQMFIDISEGSEKYIQETYSLETNDVGRQKQIENRDGILEEVVG